MTLIDLTFRVLCPPRLGGVMQTGTRSLLRNDSQDYRRYQQFIKALRSLCHLAAGAVVRSAYSEMGSSD